MKAPLSHGAKILSDLASVGLRFEIENSVDGTLRLAMIGPDSVKGRPEILAIVRAERAAIIAELQKQSDKRTDHWKELSDRDKQFQERTIQAWGWIKLGLKHILPRGALSEEIRLIETRQKQLSNDPRKSIEHFSFGAWLNEVECFRRTVEDIARQAKFREPTYDRDAAYVFEGRGARGNR